jgi:hypothetical protein
MQYEQRIVPPRQQKLEFVRPEIWKQLPAADQQACQQLLSRFIYDIFVSERTPQDEPRQD